MLRHVILLQRMLKERDWSPLMDLQIAGAAGVIEPYQDNVNSKEIYEAMADAWLKEQESEQ